MSLLFALANHNPPLVFDVLPKFLDDDEQCTVRSISQTAIERHNAECKVPGCLYAITDAWATSVDAKTAATDLCNFPVQNAPGSRLVSFRALISDAFPLVKNMVQLVFTPCEHYDHKRKTPDDELYEDSDDSEDEDSESVSSGSSSSASSKRPKLSGLSQIHGSVFRHSESRSLKLASASSDFCDIMEDHALYSDKSSFLMYIDHWKTFTHCIPFISRPRGFGIRTFLSSIEAMYDISKPGEQYEAYLDALAVVTRDGLDPYCTHNCAVLRLDLAHPSIQPENLDKSLKTYVENQIAQLFSKYGNEIHDCQWTAWSGEHAANTIFNLAVSLKYSGSPELYLIIENTTAPLLHSRSKFETERALRSFFMDVSQGHDFGHFAGIITTAYLEEGATTNTHFDQIFSDGFVDVTNHPYTQECFGFTRSDIEDLVLATAEITKPVSPDIWETLQESGIHPKQWSRPDTTPEGIRELGPPTYSMRNVLQVLAERCGQQNAQPFDNM